MAKKRKPDASRLDEVDRGMYATFCSAANSLSQLYTHAMHQQNFSFQDGERHSMEKLYNWILRQQENGIRVMSSDILSYVQRSFRYHQFFRSSSSSLNISAVPSLRTSGIFYAFGSTVGQGLCSGILDQSKNSVFSNALSSPVHWTIQHYHLSQGGNSANNAIQSNENSTNQTRDTNPPSSNFTSMDMHPDSPGHDSPY